MKIEVKKASKIAKQVISNIDKEKDKRRQSLIEEVMSILKWSWRHFKFVPKYSTKEAAKKFIESDIDYKVKMDIIDIHCRDQYNRFLELVRACEMVKTKTIDLPYHIFSEVAKYKHLVK